MTHGMTGGCVAAAPLAVGGGVINDLFANREKAVAMALFVVGPLVGA